MAPRSGIIADYDPHDSLVASTSTGTPTAAEVSRLQAAAFHAVESSQQARKQAQLETSMVNASAAAPEEPSGISIVQDPTASTSCSRSPQQQAVLTMVTAATAAAIAAPAVQHLPLAADSFAMTVGHGTFSPEEDLLDADDIQLQADDHADSTALLFPDWANAMQQPSVRDVQHSLKAQTDSPALLPHGRANRAQPSSGAVGWGAEQDRSMRAASESESLLAALQPPATAMSQDPDEDTSLPRAVDSHHCHQQQQQQLAEGLASRAAPDLPSARTPLENEQQVDDPMKRAGSPSGLHEQHQPGRHWYQNSSVAASTAASDSSHDADQLGPAWYGPAAVGPSSEALALDMDTQTSSCLSGSMHSLGHFHISPAPQSDSNVELPLACPPPINPPPDPSEPQEADPAAGKESVTSTDKQPTVSRVLSKLHSLQSMTHRLRTQSQRAIQPVTWQAEPALSSLPEEEPKKAAAAAVHQAEAHVVVFVHGFRVSHSTPHSYCMPYCTVCHVSIVTSHMLHRQLVQQPLAVVLSAGHSPTALDMAMLLCLLAQKPSLTQGKLHQNTIWCINLYLRLYWPSCNSLSGNSPLHQSIIQTSCAKRHAGCSNRQQSHAALATASFSNSLKTVLIIEFRASSSHVN